MPPSKMPGRKRAGSVTAEKGVKRNDSPTKRTESRSSPARSITIFKTPSGRKIVAVDGKIVASEADAPTASSVIALPVDWSSRLTDILVAAVFPLPWVLYNEGLCSKEALLTFILNLIFYIPGSIYAIILAADNARTRGRGGCFAVMVVPMVFLLAVLVVVFIVHMEERNRQSEMEKARRELAQSWKNFWNSW